MAIVYRVQDAEGRGPFKPGMSHRWVEPRDDHDKLLPWPLEFGAIHKKLYSWEHAGSACTQLKDLRRWFTESEYETLVKLGYRAVRLEGARILARSETQVFFGRAKPHAQDAEEVALYDGHRA